MATLFGDIRLAARLLLKNKGFTLAAVAALALGIAANNTAFTIVNGVLLRDLPFDDPERILAVGVKNAPGATFPSTTCRIPTLGTGRRPRKCSKASASSPSRA
jgi:hypothetical protein